MRQALDHRRRWARAMTRYRVVCQSCTIYLAASLASRSSYRGQGFQAASTVFEGLKPVRALKRRKVCFISRIGTFHGLLFCHKFDYLKTIGTFWGIPGFNWSTSRSVPSLLVPFQIVGDPLSMTQLHNPPGKRRNFGDAEISSTRKLSNWKSCMEKSRMMGQKCIRHTMAC